MRKAIEMIRITFIIGYQHNKKKWYWNMIISVSSQRQNWLETKLNLYIYLFKHSAFDSL